MPHCPDTLLEFYAMNRLSEREVASVEMHYFGCGACAAKAEQMVHFVETLRAVLLEQCAGQR